MTTAREGGFASRMKRRDEFIEILSRQPMFAACTKKDLQLVAKNAEHLQFRDGSNLTEEGRIGYEFFVILDGKVGVFKQGKQVNTLGPGDAFGELALLDRSPRNATVTAQSDVDVVMLAQREFTGLLQTVPTFAHKLLVGMARRIHEVEGKAI